MAKGDKSKSDKDKKDDAAAGEANSASDNHTFPMDFAKEEYKALRAEMLMRLEGMDTVLFRTVGFAAVLYSIAFIDISVFIDDTPSIDPYVARRLVLVPPLLLLVGWVDYNRRLLTVWTAADYMAKLHMHVYQPTSPLRDTVLELAGSGKWQTQNGREPVNKLNLEQLEGLLGYELNFRASNAFRGAIWMRHGTWIIMGVFAMIMIYIQFYVLEPVIPAPAS
ncbi:MAG: hypothetical protein AAF590_05745 [Pseudomonadota bacterium]